jgi:proline iminopeptidase
MSRANLYPAIEPNRTGMLDLSGGHTMYWEESGWRDGVPVVFLHGGPGAGSSAAHRRYFDPKHYRIVIFDQRGAGRSRPAAALEQNTTQHLIEDMELLRRHLGVERWFLFGGSWGSSLALAYGQAYPDRCLGFILRGIFLCRTAEVDWFLHGMSRIFPEAHRRFIEFLPPPERADPLTHYHRRLVDPDPEIHLAAARSWSAYEGACSTLLPSPETVSAFQRDSMALGLARIEAHYFVNELFVGDDQLIAHMDRISHLPAEIVQGRYDIVCPCAAAEELARAWPNAEYTLVPDAGHSAMEPGIRAALLAATDRFRKLK